MAIIQRRVAHVKGLQAALDAKMATLDIIDDISTVDGTAAFDDKVISANESKQEIDLKVNTADVQDILTSDETTKPLSAKQGKVLKGLLDGLSGGVVYKGGFDASGGAFPEDVTKGWLYKITVAGTIDGLEMAVNDTIYANKDKTGSTAAADWDKIDNTEAADILRTGNMTTEADWTLEGTKLSDRTTTKKYVDDAVKTVSTKFKNETVAISTDKFTLSEQPVENCIFMGTCSIENDDGTYDIVECSVDGSKEVTVSSTDYDGKNATVTYAFVSAS